MEYRSVVKRVSIVGITGNLLLTVFKLLAGIIGRSSAMLSDAIHSASDIAGSLIVLIGVSFAEKQPDREHPYGHERLECIASVLLAVILLLAGIAVGCGAAGRLFGGNYEALEIPGRIALIAAIVSVAAKEGMFQYTILQAKKIDSGALRAEAWHHRSDALSSVGSLVGIAGARLGLPFLDPLAGFIICAFILKAAYDIFREAMEKMTDHSADEEIERQIRACVEENGAVRGIDLLRTREFGRMLYVDLEIRMDGSLTLAQSHAVAEQLHDRLEECFPRIKHVMVHVNPD